MYTPEEIIHAANMLPITILAEDNNITLADHYLQPYLCSLVRAKFDLALKGELDFLDGIVFPDLCEILQQIPDIWRLHKPVKFQYSLGLVRADLELPSRKHYLIRQFTAFKSALERFSGRQITDEMLQQSIITYNHNRNLLSRLYQIRRANPGLFRAPDIVTVVASSMLMPKEEHSELLADLVDKAEAAAQVTNGKVRLVLLNLCDQPRKELLSLLDQLGAVIVDDNLYAGSRYFTTLVDDTLNPIEALAERYIRDVPCPTKSNINHDWADYLINMVRTAGAEGLVIILSRFCEPLGFDYPYLKKRLTEAGIRNLLLETEVGDKAVGQTRTRLQAFIEVCREEV
jgi:benzoyl-CoA reductase subunit C